ncbi:hypothetical protein [Nostoc sp.]
MPLVHPLNTVHVVAIAQQKKADKPMADQVKLLATMIYSAP